MRRPDRVLSSLGLTALCLVGASAGPWLESRAAAACRGGPAGAATAPAPAKTPARTGETAAERRDLPGPVSLASAGGLRFSADDDPITASVYSFPSTLVSASAAGALLAAVRALAPRRALVALADEPMARDLAPRARELGVRLLSTAGRIYSPWPRDPFSFTRTRAGRTLLLSRPNVQPGREEDRRMAAELAGDLPADLARAWGGLRWAEAPLPFHNGQVLLTRGAAWISLHTLEPRVLALLGEDSVPVESFGRPEGIARYVAAAEKAAAELATLYSRPVRFVHPLPAQAGSPAAAAAPAPAAAEAARDLMWRIGGGAGFDLDSLVTLLPVEGSPGAMPERVEARPRSSSGPGARAAGGGMVALVASLEAGSSLLAALHAEDLAALGRGYQLAPQPPERLREALLAAQRTPRGAGLEAFLDTVARQLSGAAGGAQRPEKAGEAARAGRAVEAAREGGGFRVLRVPLLLLPVTLLADHEELHHPDFLIGWNNVVVEAGAAGARAEGFSSLVPAGDREAHRIFAAAGCRLDLLPTLVRSVILNGGYRCASNQLRHGG